MLRSLARRSCLLAALVVGSTGCGDDADDLDGFPPRADGPAPVMRPAQCTETDYPAVAVSGASVVNGTVEPDATPLTRSQRNAIAALWTPDLPGLVCTATFIGPRSVLTAAHCIADVVLEVRMGPNARSPEERIGVQDLAEHPTDDVAILRLERSPSVPVTPLPVGGGGLRPDALVELAGYGQREDGIDQRRYAVSPVARITEDRIVVAGQGRRGLCFGDSGGPALWLSPATGRVEVVGVLSAGDTTCTDEDRYTRLSSRLDFIESELRDPPVGYPPVCDGDLTIEGACTADGQLRTCDDSGAAVRPCPSGTTCAWSETARAYDCLDAGVSACGDVTQLGACDGDVLTWCDAGVSKSRDCGACGGSCRVVDGRGGFGCADAACANLPAGGRCARDVVEYCDAEGRLRQLDCRGVGQVCRESAQDARCVVPDGLCDAIGFEGTCVEDVAVYCQQDSLRWENCAALGRSCGFVSASVGYYCL
jgi:hypothetical protein